GDPAAPARVLPQTCALPPPHSRHVARLHAGPAPTGVRFPRRDPATHAWMHGSHDPAHVWPHAACPAHPRSDARPRCAKLQQLAASPPPHPADAVRHPEDRATAAHARASPAFVPHAPPPRPARAAHHRLTTHLPKPDRPPVRANPSAGAPP